MKHVLGVGREGGGVNSTKKVAERVPWCPGKFYPGVDAVEAQGPRGRVSSSNYLQTTY